jgi:hypothetical protein
MKYKRHRYSKGMIQNLLGLDEIEELTSKVPAMALEKKYLYDLGK